MAMGLWMMTTILAPVAGPILGGGIADTIGWPWAFYINIPVGLLSAAMTWKLYHKRDPGPAKVRLDAVGLTLLVVWVGALQIMVDKGKELDWFGSPLIVALAVVAVVGFLFFLAWELTDSHPIVDLRLFARPSFAIGTVTLALAYALFFGNIVLLPLWLQQWMGYTATQAGMVMAPVGIFAILLSPWVGRNVGRMDARKIAAFSFVGFAFVLWLRSRFNTEAPFETILLPTLLQGIATACFFIPLQTVIFNGLAPHEMPAASGLSNFARITAGAVGTSIFTTAWEDRAAMHHAHLAEAVGPANAAAADVLARLHAAGMSDPAALALVNRMADQQAFTMAATDLYWLSALLFLGLIALLWLSPAPRRAGGGAAVAAAE